MSTNVKMKVLIHTTRSGRLLRMQGQITTTCHHGHGDRWWLEPPENITHRENLAWLDSRKGGGKRALGPALAVLRFETIMRQEDLPGKEGK